MRSTLMRAALLAVIAPTLSAQSLADRIGRVRDGKVRLSFATRASVCGDGRFIGFDLPDAFHMYTTWRQGYSVNSMADVRPDCRSGPLRLVIVKRAGAVDELRAAVGVEWRDDADATDLGTVPAGEAAAWLLGAAERGDGDVARVAFLAAAAADGAAITDRVLALARNRSLPAARRESAIRWAGDVAQAEGRAADADAALRALVRDEEEPRGVRERAIRELRRTDENRTFLQGQYDRIGDATLRERILRQMGEGAGDRDAAWIRTVALNERETLELRDRAVRVLGDELARPAEVRDLYSRLNRVELKERALRVVAERLDESGERWLREIVTSSTEATALRERAIRLLAERRRLDYLREVYPRLDQTELRERVVRVMAEAADDRAVAWLTAIVLDGREVGELRDRAVRSLAERGAPSQDLAGLYDKVDATDLKERLIRVLADRGDQAAMHKLTAIAADDPNPDLRRQAARRMRR